MLNNSKKLIDAEHIGRKILKCPHCPNEFVISRDTVSKMLAPNKGGCTHCATCPRCGKTSCAARRGVSLDYELNPPTM